MARYRVSRITTALILLVVVLAGVNVAPAKAVDGADLVPTGLSAPALVSADQTVTVAFAQTNQGAAAASGTPTNQVWVSADEVCCDASKDHLLVSLVGAANQGAGQASSSSVQVRLPRWAAGDHTIFVRIDATNAVAETTDAGNAEQNNSGNVSVRLEIPDLRPTGKSAPIVADAGSLLQPEQVKWTVTNNGLGPAGPPTWVDEFHFSVDAVFGNGDDLSNPTTARVPNAVVPLAPGASYTNGPTTAWRVPFTPAGNYHLVARANNFGGNPTASIWEGPTGGANNAAEAAIPIQIRVPDLIVTSFEVSPAAVAPGASVSFRYTVTNVGDAPAFSHFPEGNPSSTWLDGMQLSRDAIFDNIETSAETQVLANQSPPTRLDPGQSYTKVGTQTIPLDTAAGDWFVLLRADTNHSANSAFRSVYEGNNEGNNVNPANGAGFLLRVGNQTPSANANGPYAVDEGASTELAASGNDADGDELVIRWDLDGNETFETSGQSATYDAADQDGPAERPVGVEACDPFDACITDEATVRVRNVAPRATLSIAVPVEEGSTATASFSDPHDPSAADTAAGLRYAFTCDGSSLEGTKYESASTSATQQCEAESTVLKVRARIIDKDSGYAEYTAEAPVVNVAPSIVSVTHGPAVEGQKAWVKVEASDAGGDALSFEFDCDGDGTYESGRLEVATVECAFTDSGTFPVGIRVTDADGATVSATVEAIVENVAPSAESLALLSAAPLVAGTPVEFGLTEPFSDPSLADTATGFRYAFACDGSTFTVSERATTTCAFTTSGTYTVGARILDKDNGYTEYALDVVVEDPRSALVATVLPPVNSDGSSTFTAKRGTVPVKFELTQDGTSICDDIPLAVIVVYRITATPQGAVNEEVYRLPADGGTAFRISGCTYHYNLDATALGPGQYQVDIEIDGVAVGSARFELR